MTQPPASSPNPYSAQGSDESLWRRPAGSVAGPGAPYAPAPTRPEPEYAGPPRSHPAPPNWRPPTFIQVPEARALPPQDVAALDSEERQARTLTYGFGMIAGALALLVLAVLCGRLIF